MSRAATQKLAVALTGLHDVAVLTALYYTPILWGQVAIPEFHSPGTISSSGGQTLMAGLIALAVLSALGARWLLGVRFRLLSNAMNLPMVVLLGLAAISTLTSVNVHASKIELTRLVIGALLFLLIANRSLLPASRMSVVAAAFACSVVLSLFIPVGAEVGAVLKLLTVVGIGIAVAVMVTQREDPNPWRWWRQALILSGALVVGLYGWREKVAVAQTGNPTWQIFSTFFNPNSLGGFLAMMFPLALAALLTARLLARRLLWGFCAVVLAAAIIPTYSKGAMLALAASTVVFVVLLAYQSQRARKYARAALLAALVAGVIAGVGVVAMPPARARLASAIGVQSSSNMFRILTWQGTIRLAEAHLWLGVGPAAFTYAYPKYAIAGYVQASHQNYLQMFAELGIFGGLTFLWLLGAVLFTGGRAMRRAEGFEGRVIAIGGIAAVVVLMVHSLLDYDWYVGAINVAFWMVGGTLAHLARGVPMAAEEPEREGAEEAPSRRRRRSRRTAAKETQKGASQTSVALSAGRAAGVLGLIVVLFYCIEVPARNALAQPFINEGDAYAMSGGDTAEQRHQAAAMAFARYDRARQIDPGWSEAWERYGLIRGTVRGLDEGLEALDRAHKLSPTSFRVFTSMGQLYQFYGQNERAVDAFRSALDLFPNRTTTMRLLAGVYQKMGRQQEALEMYERIAAGENAPYNRYQALATVDVDTNFAYAYYELGRAAQQSFADGTSDSLQPALGDYNEALRVIEDYWGVAAEYDQMFEKLKRPRENREVPMRILGAKTQWRMADAYEEMGRKREAEESRRLAQSQYPDVWKAVIAEDGGA